MYILTTDVGIRDYFGGITAVDAVNYRINNYALDLYLDSNVASSVRQTDNRRLFREDLDYPVRSPTTSGYGLDIVWRNIVFLVETSTSGLTSSESATLTSINGNTGLIPALL